MKSSIAALIEWCDEYSVGVADVDLQHKRLIFLLNEINLIDNVRKNKNNHIMDLLEQLNEYADYHFQSEEALLHEHLTTHEATDGHLAAHRSYWVIMDELKKRHQDGDASVTEELVVYLNRWWINHILETDRQMGAELNRLGIH